jgi:hypothetical protein
VARAKLPEPPEVEAFLARLRARGRARLELHIDVCQDARVAMHMKGRYVALRRAKPDPGA